MESGGQGRGGEGRKEEKGKQGRSLRMGELEDKGAGRERRLKGVIKL